MRTLVALLVFAFLVPGIAAAANGEPKKALTKEGQATAHAVVVKRGDLGQGFTAVAREKDDGVPKGARCGPLDESDLTVTGDAASPDFRLAQQAAFVTVGSTAQVYRTLREANASWNRGTTSQTTTCLADIVRLSAAPGQKITVLSATRVRFPSLSPKTTAYRLVLTVKIGAQEVRAYVDAVVLQHGRVQAGILFTSLGRPVEQAQRVALAAVVAARLAKAARPSGPVA
ncbi:MAG TPA: hypothetical protein VHR46_02535 [Gaiella sp.]|jgi:hypothetical protein|nr:hypothetical protein [Gaiella sp.]